MTTPPQQSKESEALVEKLADIIDSDVSCPHYGKAPVEIEDVPDLEMVQKMHMWGNCLQCNLREALEKFLAALLAAERERCAAVIVRPKQLPWFGTQGEFEASLAGQILTLPPGFDALEKFAEGVRKEVLSDPDNKLAYQIERATKYHSLWQESLQEQRKLLQPIEDKSICPVGHMKVNLVKWDVSDVSTRDKPHTAYCLACQEQKELREAARMIVGFVDGGYHESLAESIRDTLKIIADVARQALERKDHKENHDAEDDISEHP